MSIEYPNEIVLKQQSKYNYIGHHESAEEIDGYVRTARLNWKFTSQDIEWINKEIGPHDFSLYDSNS